MKAASYCFAFLLFISILCGTPLKAQKGQSPESFFGFIPGSDGNLFDYNQLIAYFKQLDDASPRLLLKEIGLSPMGKKMYILFVSSPQNLEKLDRYKEINRKLALDWKMEDTERDSLVSEGKVFLLATLSMHSNEVGPTQASPQIVYSLANTQDPEMLKCLDNVVFMIVPNHNPDDLWLNF